MTTSIKSLFQAVLFRKYDFVVLQLKHLTPKTTSLRSQDFQIVVNSLCIFIDRDLKHLNSFVDF